MGPFEGVLKRIIVRDPCGLAPDPQVVFGYGEQRPPHIVG